VLNLQLSDVTLCVTSREDADWEEGPALARAQAAKQAQLAAAELKKLGKRVEAEGRRQQQQGEPPLPQSASSTGGDSSGGTVSGSGGRWSVVDWLVNFLLRQLQVTITNVHVYFEVRRVPTMMITFNGPGLRLWGVEGAAGWVGGSRYSRSSKGGTHAHMHCKPMAAVAIRDAVTAAAAVIEASNANWWACPFLMALVW
jgi:hypothetical protein